jgi:DNA-directed RNA polymerase I and III subunit RPAC1
MKVLDRPSDSELVFEMVGIDASFANALRRILLADVPTMAIEHVYMWNNTSIIHDEVLAHRLGLVPINVDARLFEEMEPGEDPTDGNTLVFRLAVTCKDKKRGGTSDNVSPEDPVVANPELQEAAEAAAANRKAAIETPGRPYTKHVYSSDLQWVAQGDQEERFPNGIQPVHDDILLAKLRPGQCIELEAHAHWGTGQNHAKYSPVATVCYRLMPHIELVHPVYDELAEQLVNLYEPGVFDLVETDSSDPDDTRVKARVVNPYACTMSRNYMRDATLAKSIKMSRIPNHFIFSVESVGMMSPAVLVAEALRVLQKKCQRLSALADESGMAGEDADMND